MSDDPILQEGRNCWKIARADRLSYLIDAQSYFSAVVDAARRAEHSILLLGWDFHSRLRLVRDEDGNERTPPLRDFLNQLVKEKKSLQVHMLEWDWAEIYALEREILPALKLDWQTHRRFHFHLDDEHPVGASHHQKVVVVDDAVAFVGGLDLTKNRWDTPEHDPDDPRRTDPDGEPYGPFHDVQVVVAGEAAAALGELARERWRRATGEELTAPPSGGEMPWPRGLEAEVEDAAVAIARTEPAHLDRAAVDEVATLHTDAIAAARRFIYIENQYFTSSAIGDALAERLQEEDGPEVVMVLPRRCSGHLEQSTMGVLRERLLHRLRTSDPHSRLRVYYPRVPGLGDAELNLHAKVLVVDDRLAKVGSSNLSNRSMGFDTECDLILEANNDALREAVASLRNRLLAEHLGTSEEEVAETLREADSLARAVESLRAQGRTLEPLEPEDPSDWQELASNAAELADPAEPVDMEGIIHDFVEEADEESTRGGHTRLKWFLVAAVLLALTAAWRWTPLGEYLQPEHIVASLRGVSDDALAPLYVVIGYVIGGVLSAPVTLLIVATSLMFGAARGFLYAMVGIAASAAVTYGAGRLLGRRTLQHVAGSRIGKVKQFLSKQGLWATILIRNVPVAPFTIVNVIAGASQIRFRDYLLGTVLGMAPGTLAIMLLERSVTQALKDPDLTSLALLAAAITAITGAVFAFRHWLRRRGDLPR